MDYPDEFLKGIPNNKYIGINNLPSADLFYWHEQHQKNIRNDDFLEESINWRFDIGADYLIFSQLKDDNSLQFKGGAALMCRKELDHMIRLPHINGILNYERAVKPDNIYHGNLIIKKSLPNLEKKKIAAAIAVICFLEIIPNPNL